MLTVLGIISRFLIPNSIIVHRCSNIHVVYDARNNARKFNFSLYCLIRPHGGYLQTSRRKVDEEHMLFANNLFINKSREGRAR